VLIKLATLLSRLYHLSLTNRAGLRNVLPATSRVISQIGNENFLVRESFPSPCKLGLFLFASFARFVG
jgi:hypothetical protein